MVTVPVSVVSEVQGDARWVIASARIPKDLAPCVVSWVGYAEFRPRPQRQRELPGGSIHLIFEFGPPVGISASGGEVCLPRHEQSFVVGLDDRFAFTEHAGEQAGVQVSLTPIGARQVLGLPLHELTRQVVDVGALDCFRGHAPCDFGRADSWEERFAWVTRFLRSRLAASRARRDVAHAVQRIRTSGGRLSVGELARELGFSRKHLAALFQDQVGVTPKLYADLVRFERLTAILKAPVRLGFAQIAQELGFADQAHLARSVKRFSGLAPRDLAVLLGAPHVDLFEAR